MDFPGLRNVPDGQNLALENGVLAMVSRREIRNGAGRSFGGVDSPVQDFIARLEKASGLHETWQIINDEFATYGVEHLIYMFMRPGAPHDNALVLSNLPGWWADYYLEENRARHDPFFKTCFTFAPIGTGPVFNDDNSHLINDDEKQFINEASETGLRSGFASPVRLRNPGHFGGWNFGTSMTRAQFERYMPEHCERLQLMGFIAHEALQRQAATSRVKTDGKQLSARERECLLWLARGLRSHEIADQLNLATTTIDLYFRRVRKKLHAATREEALAKAILSGEVVP